MTITDGMAAATSPGLYHTAEAAHMEGVDFAGKTGTAQVVGGGDTHTKGGAKTPNAWFVGMIPRRNPEVAIVVLQEHGDWGSGSAMIAQKIAITYVNKQRMREKNILVQSAPQKPVEMGAVWTEGREQGTKGTREQGSRGTVAENALHGGHFVIDPTPAAPVTARFTASSLLPTWLQVALLRFKEEKH